MNPQTLDTLVKSIRNYPDVRSLLFQSTARAPVNPINIKNIISTVLSGNILKIDYHCCLKTMIFGLAWKAPVVPEFAIKDDSFWGCISTNSINISQ